MVAFFMIVDLALQTAIYVRWRLKRHHSGGGFRLKLIATQQKRIFVAHYKGNLDALRRHLWGGKQSSTVSSAVTTVLYSYNISELSTNRFE